MAKGRVHQNRRKRRRASQIACKTYINVPGATFLVQSSTDGDGGSHSRGQPIIRPNTTTTCCPVSPEISDHRLYPLEGSEEFLLLRPSYPDRRQDTEILTSCTLVSGSSRTIIGSPPASAGKPSSKSGSASLPSPTRRSVPGSTPGH